MPALAGKNYSDTELLLSAKKALYERSRLLAPEDTLAAVQDLKVWVGEELSFEEAASASFGRVLSELWHAEYLDQLPPLLNKFERLASAYFVRRGSVPAFHGFCTAWREGLLRRILLFAEEGLEINDHGHPPVPYALLASGSLGRREQTIEETDPYFLVWKRGEGKYFEQFAYRVLAILDQLGLLGKDPAVPVVRILWRGPLKEWELYAGADGESADGAARLELLADLRYICGDEAVGQEAVTIARSLVASCREGSQYRDLAAEAASSGVGLGMFGDIRVEKSGSNKGCFNIVNALRPLVSAVRLLAIRHDLDPGPTLVRLASLSEMEILKAEHAERLEAAYHLLAGLKIGREIALEQPYVKPVDLSATERQKLKAALEAVRELQQVIRLSMPGKDAGRKIFSLPVTLPFRKRSSAPS